MSQLTIDGREEDVANVMRRLSASPTERELLRAMVRAGGSIRSSEAGRVIHGSRGHCAREQTFPVNKETLSCCDFGPLDGYRVMRGMEKKGLVYKPRRGLWRVVGGL